MSEPSPSIFLVGDNLDAEVEIALAAAQSFATGFLPGLGWLALFLVLTFVLTCLAVSCWGFLLRACRARSNATHLSQIVLGALLLFTGVALSFGAVGINFFGILFGTTLIAAAWITTCTNNVDDFSTGVRLHTYRVLDDHEKVTLTNHGVSGRLRAVGLFTTELFADAKDTKSGDTSETYLIPNRFMLSGPLKIEWKTPRSRERGSIETGRSDAFRHPPPAYTDVRAARGIDTATGVATSVIMAADDSRGSSGSSTLQRRVSAALARNDTVPTFKMSFV